jgi:hypothetical protein
VSQATAFDWLCTELESRCSLDRLEARGTVRLALKQSGLDVRMVTGEQMAVVIERVLPEELRARGIDGGDQLCEGLLQSLKDENLGGHRTEQSPDEIFRRLGGQ